jgi:ribosomal protein S18 acetylase RimI-like enzyme
MTTIDRQSITFRPVRDEDRAFMAALYASTRTEEMQYVPWEPEQKAQFLAMQFEAQTHHYAREYDPSGFFIIEQAGQPIGRLYRERQEEEIHLIDIALIPEVRGGGLGSVLLQEILDEAAAEGIAVTIYVEHFNPAKRLYQRLGFKEIGENGVYHLMRWEAPAKEAEASHFAQ